MIRVPFQSFRSEPVDLGDGFSIEFTFDGERLECQWLPDVPPNHIGRGLMPAYRRARDGFLNSVARKMGASVMVVDL